MTIGAHTILFAEDPERARAFFRDVLGWQNVDAGGGWLIFKSPPAEIAMHPTAAGAQKHELWLMCDDLAATRQQLEQKGVIFTQRSAKPVLGLPLSSRYPAPAPSASTSPGIPRQSEGLR